jgi:hypothetical protein
MIIYGVLVVFFIWLVYMTFQVSKVKSHYYRFILRTRKEKIDDILDKLIDDDKKTEKNIEQLKASTLELQSQSRLHFQKIGFLRFNPFGKNGTEQSYVVAILDKDNNGIVSDYIYTREGLRVYSKKVKKGAGEEYDLNEEEKRAIAKSH